MNPAETTTLVLSPMAVQHLNDLFIGDHPFFPDPAECKVCAEIAAAVEAAKPKAAA